MGRIYAINSRQEARAYLADATLASRLYNIIRTAIESGRSLDQLFKGSKNSSGKNHVDARKLQACCTLFSVILETEAPEGWKHELVRESIFQDALNHFWGGEQHKETLDILATWPAESTKSLATHPTTTPVGKDTTKKNTNTPTATNEEQTKPPAIYQPTNPGFKNTTKNNNTTTPSATIRKQFQKRKAPPLVSGKGANGRPKKRIRSSPGKASNVPVPREPVGNGRLTGHKGDIVSVDSVRESRIEKGRLEYRIHSADNDKKNGWVSAGELKLAPLDLDDFHKGNPTAVGPPCRLNIWRSAYFRGESDTVVGHDDDNTAWPKVAW